MPQASKMTSPTRQSNRAILLDLGEYLCPFPLLSSSRIAADVLGTSLPFTIYLHLHFSSFASLIMRAPSLLPQAPSHHFLVLI